MVQQHFYFITSQYKYFTKAFLLFYISISIIYTLALSLYHFANCQKPAFFLFPFFQVYTAIRHHNHGWCGCLCGKSKLPQMSKEVIRICWFCSMIKSDNFLSQLIIRSYFFICKGWCISGDLVLFKFLWKFNFWGGRKIWS